MPQQVQLAGVGIAVNDVATMHRFYSEVLGFGLPPLPAGAQHFLVPAGEADLAFFHTAGTSPAATRAIATFLSNPVGLDHLRLRVTDMPGVLSRLAAHGTVPQEVPGLDDGIARITDPEGNLLGLQAQ